MDSKLYAVEKNTRSIGIKNKLSQVAEKNHAYLHIHIKRKIRLGGETEANDTEREGCDRPGHACEHTYPLSRSDEAYELFENKREGVIKVAVEC